MNWLIVIAVDDMLVSDIAEPQGVRAASRMWVLVTIAPPI